MLPLAAIALLLVAQVALLVAEQLVVQHAAREGAREAAVSNDDVRARDAVLRAGNFEPERTQVEVTPSERRVGTPVRVAVRYRPQIAVPFVGRFLPEDLTLSASASFRVERDPATASPSPSPTPSPLP